MRRFLALLLLVTVADAAPKRTLKVKLDNKVAVTAKRAWFISEKNFDRLIISFEDPANATVDPCNKATTNAPTWKAFPAYLSIMFTLDKSADDVVDLSTVPMPMAVNYMKTQLSHVGAPTGDVEGSLAWSVSGDRRHVRVRGKAAARRMAANDGSIVLTAPQLTFDGEIDVVTCPVK